MSARERQRLVRELRERQTRRERVVMAPSARAVNEDRIAEIVRQLREEARERGA